MKLTGKCKESFEKWYRSKLNMSPKVLFTHFISLPQSMQYGVYVDFFDTVGLSIELFMTPDHQLKWTYSFSHSELCKTEFNNRQEARQSSIEKANEIFNNR